MIDKKILILLLLLGIIFRLIFASLIPPFTGNDEPAHLRYAQHIRDEKRLPDANLYKNEELAGNEYFQPPLYYTLAAIVISFSQHSITQLQVLRVLSIILWLFALYFTYKTLTIIKSPAFQSVSTLAFISLLPTYIVNSATVTNDALVIPLAAITIYYLISTLNQKRVTYSQLTLFSLLTSLTILAKLNGLILVPAAIVTIFLMQKKVDIQFFKKSFFYIFFSAVFIFWWFLYNYLTYHNLQGPIEASTAAFNKIPFGANKIYLILRGTFATFWVAYGPANEIRLPTLVYEVLFLITLCSIFGNFLYLKNLTIKKTRLFLKTKPVIILLIALITNTILLVIFNINQHQPLGRYLFPSLIQISAIFSIGLYLLTPGAARKYVPVFLILGLLTLNIWGAITLSNLYF